MSRRLGVTLAVAVCACVLSQEARAAGKLLPVVTNFNVANIYGSYYEIASYPQWYSNNCTNTSIAFGATNNASVTSVLMSCDRGVFRPKVTGTAVPLSRKVPARMWVDLRPPVGGSFTQEFDVIMAGRDFSYFVIGHPARKQLFVLSRYPSMSYANMNYILSRLETFYGYANVRRNARCTEHGGYSNGGCIGALSARSLFDDLSAAYAEPMAPEYAQDATDEAETTLR